MPNAQDDLQTYAARGAEADRQADAARVAMLVLLADRWGRPLNEKASHKQSGSGPQRVPVSSGGCPCGVSQGLFPLIRRVFACSDPRPPLSLPVRPGSGRGLRTTSSSLHKASRGPADRVRARRRSLSDLPQFTDHLREAIRPYRSTAAPAASLAALVRLAARFHNRGKRGRTLVRSLPLSCADGR